jgi:hypothetical protein
MAQQQTDFSDTVRLCYYIIRCNEMAQGVRAQALADRRQFRQNGLI